MMEVVSGDNWNYKSCKASVKSSPTNQHPFFYRGRMSLNKWKVELVLSVTAKFL